MRRSFRSSLSVSGLEDQDVLVLIYKSFECLMKLDRIGSFLVILVKLRSLRLLNWSIAAIEL